MDKIIVQPNVVLPKMCPIDSTLLVFDADGSITGLGEPCWYCPECGYIDV